MEIVVTFPEGRVRGCDYGGKERRGGEIWWDIRSAEEEVFED